MSIPEAVLGDISTWATGLAKGCSIRTEFCPVGESPRIAFRHLIERAVTEEQRPVACAAYGDTSLTSPFTTRKIQGDASSFVTLVLPASKLPVLYHFECIVRHRGKASDPFDTYVLVIPVTAAVAVSPTAAQPQDPIAVLSAQRAILMERYGLDKVRAGLLIDATSPTMAVEAARLGAAALKIINNGPHAAMSALERTAQVQKGRRSKLRQIFSFEAPEVPGEELQTLIAGAVRYLDLLPRT